MPSIGWWTSLVTQQWSGQLWAYPAMLKATPAGIELNFPRRGSWAATTEPEGVEDIDDLNEAVSG